MTRNIQIFYQNCVFKIFIFNHLKKIVRYSTARETIWRRDVGVGGKQKKATKFAAFLILISS